MEKPIKLREADGTKNVTVREPETLKDEPHKKKKLVFFELDNRDNEENKYEVPNVKVEGKMFSFSFFLN